MDILFPVATIFNFCVIIYYLYSQDRINNLNENFINRLMTDVTNMKRKIDDLKKISDSKQD